MKFLTKEDVQEFEKKFKTFNLNDTAELGGKTYFAKDFVLEWIDTLLAKKMEGVRERVEKIPTEVLGGELPLFKISAEDFKRAVLPLLNLEEQ